MTEPTKPAETGTTVDAVTQKPRRDAISAEAFQASIDALGRIPGFVDTVTRVAANVSKKYDASIQDEVESNTTIALARLFATNPLPVDEAGNVALLRLADTIVAIARREAYNAKMRLFRLYSPKTYRSVLERADAAENDIQNWSTEKVVHRAMRYTMGELASYCPECDGTGVQAECLDRAVVANIGALCAPDSIPSNPAFSAWTGYRGRPGANQLVRPEHPFTVDKRRKYTTVETLVLLAKGIQAWQKCMSGAVGLEAGELPDALDHLKWCEECRKARKAALCPSCKGTGKRYDMAARVRASIILDSRDVPARTRWGVTIQTGYALPVIHSHTGSFWVEAGQTMHLAEPSAEVTFWKSVTRDAMSVVLDGVLDPELIGTDGPDGPQLGLLDKAYRSERRRRNRTKTHKKGEIRRFRHIGWNELATDMGRNRGAIANSVRNALKKYYKAHYTTFVADGDEGGEQSVREQAVIFAACPATLPNRDPRPYSVEVPDLLPNRTEADLLAELAKAPKPPVVDGLDLFFTICAMAATKAIADMWDEVYVAAWNSAKARNKLHADIRTLRAWNARIEALAANDAFWERWRNLKGMAQGTQPEHYEWNISKAPKRTFVATPVNDHKAQDWAKWIKNGRRDAIVTTRPVTVRSREDVLSALLAFAGHSAQLGN